MAEKKKMMESAAPAADKKKALETAMAQIEKTYGKGAIMRLGTNTRVVVESIPTGSVALDLALGIGGVPRGRIIEIYGPESSGKTTLALHIAAEAQKRGGEVAFIDAEHALDPTYARALGVDIDNMLISQPDTGEQGLEICEALVRSGALDVIVVDSVAALVPRAEIEGDMGDAHVGLLARLMSQALRKLAGSISKTNCVVIFINQLREKVGVMYGNPEVTTGGRALKFYSSVRMEVRRVEPIKAGSEIIGNRTRAKVVKNKVAPPFREAEFDIMYGEGISKYGELVDLAVKLDIIQKSGSWFSMGEERIGQGKDAAKQYLRDNPEICERVEAEIRQNSFKLLSNQAQAAARAAGRAPQEAVVHSAQPAAAPAAPKGIDVSADDFDDDEDCAPAPPGPARQTLDCGTGGGRCPPGPRGDGGGIFPLRWSDPGGGAAGGTEVCGLRGHPAGKNGCPPLCPDAFRRPAPGEADGQGRHGPPGGGGGGLGPGDRPAQ